MNSEIGILAQLAEFMSNKEPHWFVKILIGLLVGLALPYVVRALKWPLLFFQGHILRGGWWEYHYSTMDNADQIYEGSLRIRPGLSGSLVFRLNQEETGLKYVGRVKPETGSDQFVLLGKSTDSANEEYMIWRFHLPIKSKKEKVITGVNASYNHDKKPYASIAILTKNRVGVKEAGEIIKNVQIDTGENSLLRVRKSLS